MARDALLEAIRKQLEIYTDPSGPKHQAIISVSSLGYKYAHALTDLQEVVQCLAPADSPAPSLAEPSLGWKVLAFAGAQPYILNHAYLWNVCLQKNIIGVSAKAGAGNIWHDPKLISWIDDKSSSLLLVHGTQESVDGLHIFGAQLATVLSKQTRAIVYVAGGVWETLGSDERDAMVMDSVQILRHVAIQVLRCMSTVSRVEAGRLLLLHIIRITKAESEDDWLTILEMLTFHFPHLDIIIDVGTLFQYSDGIPSWAQNFEKMIENLRRYGNHHDLRVVIISPHPMPGASAKVPSISVEGPLLEPTELPALIPSSSSTVTGAEPRLPTADAPLTDQYAEPASRQDFSIAIFCAFPIEAGIIDGLFTSHWDADDFGKAPGDTNTYSLGRIGNLNVVLVHVADVGKGPAASAASNCHSSFTEINLSLIVGTCGAVPSVSKERALGDVIISDALVQFDLETHHPGESAGEMVQFDLEINDPEEYAGEKNTRDNLGKQTPEITSFLDKLKSQSNLEELHLSTWNYLESLRKYENWKEVVRYPGAHQDVAYEASYIHKHRDATLCLDWDESCGTDQGSCGVARVARCEDLHCKGERRGPRKEPVPPPPPARQASAAAKAARAARAARTARAGLPASETHRDPHIRFGTIASGDQFMRSGEDRDYIAKQEGIVAFEMEGAGVWDVFPCIIVKGVSNYADSHRSNSIWKAYAAAAAATCAVSLLEQWSLEDLHKHPVVEEEECRSTCSDYDGQTSRIVLPLRPSSV
ncbi:hypothetical protein PT974_01286 [Cladobotryum mycophilum]|uniref:Nucleoside phosphorylase domain-containing protein n=1 Tax=Cladobotryum mycophilum TaxID=491253 RepID=A0ABR0T3J1_9HYPO